MFEEGDGLAPRTPPALYRHDGARRIRRNRLALGASACRAHRSTTRSADSARAFTVRACRIAFAVTTGVPCRHRLRAPVTARPFGGCGWQHRPAETHRARASRAKRVLHAAISFRDQGDDGAAARARIVRASATALQIAFGPNAACRTARSEMRWTITTPGDTTTTRHRRRRLSDDAARRHGHEFRRVCGARLPTASDVGTAQRAGARPRAFRAATLRRWTTTAEDPDAAAAGRSHRRAPSHAGVGATEPGTPTSLANADRSFTVTLAGLRRLAPRGTRAE